MIEQDAGGSIDWLYEARSERIDDIGIANKQVFTTDGSL